MAMQPDPQHRSRPAPEGRRGTPAEAGPGTVGVVVLTHNQRELTCACLRSLLAGHGCGIEVVLVDNGSTDGTLDEVRREFPSVATLRSEENLGVAGGRNLGIAHVMRSGVSYVWVVDNDTVVPAGAAGALRDYMESHPDVGIAAATVCSGDDPERVCSTGGRIRWLVGEACHPERGTAYAALREQEVAAAFISGCNMFIRAAALRECGLLDERFFYYGEDVDLSLRVRRRGYRLVSLRSPVIYHLQHGALGAVSPLKTYFSVRNRFLWMEKNAPRTAWLLFNICWRLQFYGRFLPRRVLAGDTETARAALRGLRDYRRRCWPSDLQAPSQS